MLVGYLALIMDCLIGDPRTSYHPVVLMGKLISLLEKFFYRPADTEQKKLASGAVLMVIVLAVSYGLAAFVVGTARWKAPFLSPLVEAAILSLMISPRTLAAAGKEIQTYLEAGDLKNARLKVGWIVGRDTDRLTEGEVVRATVETIAENTVDGIISPLFFWWLGGVPLAVAYRAANTMDSMIGYKNEKYLYFGRCAAKADDVWNYLPARLTGLILVAAAWLWRYDYKNAWNMLNRDADKHPSPNGGYTEATVAGALGIRLGGLNYYFGQPSFRTYMGDALNEIKPYHIKKVTNLMYTATVIFLLFITLI